MRPYNLFQLQRRRWDKLVTSGPLGMLVMFAFFSGVLVASLFIETLNPYRYSK